MKLTFKIFRIYKGGERIEKVFFESINFNGCFIVIRVQFTS
jgi:hypothetical protein